MLPAQHQKLEVSAVCARCTVGDELALFIDNRLEHVWNRPPYRVLWSLEPGQHTIHVVHRASFSDPFTSPSVEIQVTSEAQQLSTHLKPDTPTR
jgi:hypothetical protein